MRSRLLVSGGLVKPLHVFLFALSFIESMPTLCPLLLQPHHCCYHLAEKKDHQALMVNVLDLFFLL